MGGMFVTVGSSVKCSEDPGLSSLSNMNWHFAALQFPGICAGQLKLMTFSMEFSRWIIRLDIMNRKKVPE